MVTLVQLILSASTAATAPADRLGLNERCAIVEATLSARGEVVHGGKTVHVEPFVDRFRKLTSRGDRTWLRVKGAKPRAWMFEEGESCGPGLVLARESPARFDPTAPQEVVQIEFLEPIRTAENAKTRFVQRMTVFSIRKGSAAAQEPMCYLGELTKGPARWSAIVLEMKIKASTACR